MERYSLELKRSACREIEDLPTKKDRRLVVDRIAKLADDPRPPANMGGRAAGPPSPPTLGAPRQSRGAPREYSDRLLGSEKLAGDDRYRVRQGPYRIIYAMNDVARTVVIVKIGHRREVSRR